MSLLSDFNLVQHVHFPTHDLGHILDLIIGPSDSACNPQVSCFHSSPSDHKPVITTLELLVPPTPERETHSFRRIAAINIDKFIADIEKSDLILHPPPDLGNLVECYNTTLRNLLDQHAPLITKTRCHPPNPWYTPALRSFKILCRKAERAWLKSKNNIDWNHYRKILSDYHTKITTEKQEYNSNKISHSMDRWSITTLENCKLSTTQT